MKYLTYIFIAGLMLLVVSCGVSKATVEETFKGKNCTLSGGEIVESGWFGKDTGSNFCNQCTCMQDGPNMGALVCTEMYCDPKNKS